MTNWTPGVKADATKVVDLLIDRYTNPTKNAIRKWVIAELKAAEPTLVLDLWGGGKSAAEMAAAGLPVLSVDDGRSFAEFGITKPRGKRAMLVKADEFGYRTGWGSVVKCLPECDAAWLDFMGHPCKETERALAACKGKKIVVLTLMASRLAGHEGLSVASYIAMYRGLIEGLSGLRVTTVRKYRRPDGQWALVFLARARGFRPPTNLTLRNAQARSRWVDPGYSGPRNARNKAAYQRDHGPTPPCANCGGPQARRGGLYCGRAECQGARLASYAREYRGRPDVVEHRRAKQKAKREAKRGASQEPPSLCANCGSPVRRYARTRESYCRLPKCRAARLRSARLAATAQIGA